MRVLNLGSGRRGLPFELPEGEHTILTLDQDRELHPDLLCKLGVDPIPLPDDSIDIAVAWHILEHIGKQCETEEWFYFFEELYRVLTPVGELHMESPLYNSVWAWADPSHTRALAPISFLYFIQNSYRCGGAISPFRIECDFESLGFELIPDGNADIAKAEKFSHFRGVFRAVKPLRPWWEDADAIVPDAVMVE